MRSFFLPPDKICIIDHKLKVYDTNRPLQVNMKLAELSSVPKRGTVELPNPLTPDKRGQCSRR